MRIINFLKSLFKKKQTETEIETESIDDSIAANINICLNTDLSVLVNIDWNSDNNPDLPLALGGMLKFLTNGEYDHMISDALVKSASDDNIDAIEQVLMIWKSEDFTEIRKQINKIPVINPLRTFGESNFGG